MVAYSLPKAAQSSELKTLCVKNPADVRASHGFLKAGPKGIVY